MLVDYEHTVLIPAMGDALTASNTPLSSTHDVVTEAIPVIAEDSMTTIPLPR